MQTLSPSAEDIRAEAAVWAEALEQSGMSMAEALDLLYGDEDAPAELIEMQMR